MTTPISKTGSPDEPIGEASSSSFDVRQDRSIKPLGSARRPGRSRTPTPSNPHPNVSSTAARSTRDHLSHHSVNSAANTSARRGYNSNIFDSRASSSSSSSSYNYSPTLTSTRSRSTQAQVERRPWFPYPPPNQPTLPTHQRASSSSARRISNISNDSVSSNSNASTSSASSYNSEDITTRIDRRAISAEPEQWSQAASRGRSLRDPSRGSKARLEGAIQESEMGHHKWSIEERENVGGSSSSDEEKERAHFKSVLRAFDAYLSHSLAANNARRRSFYSLPRSHRLLLSSLGAPLPGPVLKSEGGETEKEASLAIAGRGFKARLDEVDDRIRRNADVLSQIVDDSRGFLGEEEEEEGEGEAAAQEGNAVVQGVSHPEVSDDGAAVVSEKQSKISIEGGFGAGVDGDGKMNVAADEGDKSTSNGGNNRTTRSIRPSRQRIPDHDLDKVRSTIKQFVRDWSDEGTKEREAAYDPILEALETAFKHVSAVQRNRLRVLVPGAGLGRLAFEIAWLGFSCQGNEFSFYMLLASHFILNKTTRINQHIIYPFIHSSSNWRTADDMLKAIQIPDINPSDLPSHVDFSMVAGEFIEVYSKKQEKVAWDAITTCFFIDTAHNLTRYLEVINHVLVMGGVWINVGPLLWHYEGAVNGDLSIELTLDEVLGLIELMGFHIESQRTLKPQTYTGNEDSMLSYQYSPEFWIARKIREVAPAKVA